MTEIDRWEPPKILVVVLLLPEGIVLVSLSSSRVGYRLARSLGAAIVIAAQLRDLNPSKCSIV